MVEKQYKLSIITINYNNKEGLKKTIQSIVSQENRDFEWIVIDGGSTDGGVEYLKQYSEYFTYWVSEKDRGIYNAMNKGIQHSRGDYLLFLNSGDRFFADSVLSKVFPLLQGDDFYIGDIMNDKDGKMSLVQFPRCTDVQTLLNQLIFEFIPHQASFIHRRIFESQGLYREDLRIASDWFLFYKSFIFGNPTIKVLEFPIAVFDCTGISSTDVNRCIERFSSQTIYPYLQELFRFYRDNHEFIESVDTCILGRFFKRLYFLFYRKFIKKLKR